MLCNNLVFAAGPWTPEAFRRLFKNTVETLENNVHEVYWLGLAIPTAISAIDDVGLVFPDLATSVKEFNDTITIAALAARRQLRVTAVSAEGQNAELDRTHATTPEIGEEPAYEQLEKLVAKRTIVPTTLEESVPPEGASDERGFSLVSTANRGLPIIDRVPTKHLSIRDGNEEELDAQPTGVWFCYGFGMLGTALAPGAARALVKRLCGMPSGLPEGKFAFPG